jgi:acyl-coenzyme A synthetase/AMP-(fatty) acid ligase/thioesterase domain-containing protein/acyl carrier protein
MGAGEGDDERATIAHALVDQMAQTPELLAVSGEDLDLTYAELDEQSARLTHALDAVDPERTCVATGVLLPMGATAVLGLVAAARSGRPVIALDVAWPTSRIVELCDQVGRTVVLTDRAHVHLLPEGTPAALVDDLPPDLPTGPPPLWAGPDDPFSITFTSGSTGRPKGAVRSHRSQLDSVRRMARDSGYGPGVRLGLVFEYTFAACRTTVWGGLGNGATVFVRDVRAHGPTGLAPWLAACGINRVTAPASLLEAMVELDPPTEPFTELEHIAFAGDILRTETVRRLWPHLPPTATIENVYGSSEMGGVAQYRFTRDAPLDGALVPAGPINRHVELRIVEPDERGVGEIVVSSPMVSMGYVDGSTDAQDSFFESEGRLWFRSRDLGRLRPDGMLEVLGRLDDRVKIRAQAVDPAEVEREVAALDGIREASVQARPVGGALRLVAYVVPKPGVDLTVSGVRRGLRGTLPGWMIPQSVVVLDAIPRTDRGKVDRKALPDPGRGRPRLEVDHDPPRTPVETAAVQAFEAVLDLEGIGRFDEFFDLGGDSLSAVEVVVRLGRMIGRELDLDAFRDRATPAAIAERLAEDAERGEDRLVVFHEAGSRTPIVHVHSGHGFTISMAHLAATTEGTRPYLGVQMLHGDRTRDLLAVDRLATRYADLLDERRPGPVVVSGYSGGSFLAHAVAAELERRGRPVVALALLDPPSRPGAELRARDLGYLGVSLTGWRLPMTRRVQERTVASAWGARRHRATVIEAPILVLQGELADPTAWQARTSGEVLAVAITGDHRAMLDPPHVLQLGAELEAGLQRLEARSPSASAASGDA